MTYPGNATLSAAIQQRILSTFQQTRDLAAGGNHQEALLGCDFILRLDPDFEPAKELMERLKSRTGEGPVEVADLDPEAAAAPEPADEGDGLWSAAPPPPGPDTDAAAPSPSPPSPPSPPPPAEMSSALAAGMAELLDRRELKRLVQVAEENRREVAADPKLRKIVETAYSRLEAEPYLEGFLGSARQALQEGDEAEAARLLSKARSLDPTHPGIAEVEQVRGFYDDPARRMGGRRQGIELEEPAAEEGAAGAAAAVDFGADLPAFDLVDEPDGRSGAPSGGLATEPIADADEDDLADLEPPPFPFETPEAEAGAASPPPATAGARPGAGGGDGRIQELLDEGQAAFDRGELQDAIDSWSRIFLIDIDHQEAARRIEQARRLKAEGERRVEEIYHGAMSALDSGDAEAARREFERVLELQPNHLAAREYLQQIEEGETPAPPPPTATRLETVAVPEEEAAAGEEILKEEIIVPPPPGTRPPPARPTAGKPGAAGSRRIFLAIGGAVLVLVVIAGAFAVLRWDDLFENTTEVAEPAAPASHLVDRATRLNEGGNVQQALGLLRRVPPGDPRFQEAQELIGRWEAPPAASPAAEEAAVSPEQLARRDQLLEWARGAYARGEYLPALEAFERAAEVAPLEGTAADLVADTRLQLAPLERPLRLFRDGEWEFALRQLWEMHESEPGNRDVVRLMVDSYYNLAVRALGRYDPEQAASHLGEALDLAPGSPVLERQKQFAETYTRRQPDLLYEIYVKYLPFRKYD